MDSSMIAGPSLVAPPRADTAGPLRVAVRRILRRSWWWGQFRRVQHEGFGRAWQRRRSWSAILRTDPAMTTPLSQAAAYELHILCWFGDYVSCIWALKSYLRHSDASCHLYIHLQGHATSRMRDALQRHFPHARVIPQSEADAHVIAALRNAGYSQLQRLRAECSVMMKLVDVALYGRTDRLLVLDSDVLFFRRPDVLLSGLLQEDCGPLMAHDVDSCYVLSPEQARELGVDLAPRLNSGIVAIRRSTLDLAVCESWCRHPAFAVRSGWAEQTLYALLASRTGRPSTLPPAYAISMERDPEPANLVARHYSGPSRPFLTTQGMEWLISEGGLAGRTA